MNLEQFNDKFKKYVKEEYQEEAKQLAHELMVKREIGQLSKIDTIKKVPKIFKMIKPEYRNKAISLLKNLKK